MMDNRQRLMAYQVILYLFRNLSTYPSFVYRQGSYDDAALNLARESLLL